MNRPTPEDIARELPPHGLPVRWSELGRSVRFTILDIAQHTLGHKDPSRLRRVYDIGNPRIIITAPPSGLRFDVHPEDVPAFTLLIRSYL